MKQTFHTKSVNLIGRPNQDLLNHLLPLQQTHTMSLPQILVDGDEPITFTEIEPWHRDRLVQMHEDLFPVKYSKGFYDKAVIKTGLRGCPLFTSIAFQKRGGLDVMVGFVMAQFLPVEQCDARSDLFDALNEPEYVYYILTLGVEKSMRCTGLGTTLLHQCLDHAATNLACGAVSGLLSEHITFHCNTFDDVVSVSMSRCIFMLLPTTNQLFAFTLKMALYL